MTAPSSAGERAAICSPLKPPQDFPMMPTLPVHQGWTASQLHDLDAVGLLEGEVLVVQDAVGVARAPDVDPDRGVAVAGEVAVDRGVSQHEAVVLAVRHVLHDRGHRIVARRPPATRCGPRAGIRPTSGSRRGARPTLGEESRFSLGYSRLASSAT